MLGCSNIAAARTGPHNAHGDMMLSVSYQLGRLRHDASHGLSPITAQSEQHFTSLKHGEAFESVFKEGDWPNLGKIQIRSRLALSTQPMPASQWIQRPAQVNDRWVASKTQHPVTYRDAIHDASSVKQARVRCVPVPKCAIHIQGHSATFMAIMRRE